MKTTTLMSETDHWEAMHRVYMWFGSLDCNRLAGSWPMGVQYWRQGKLQEGGHLMPRNWMPSDDY